MLADVENCDLMLFRSKKLTLQKRLGKWEYDHIAMLLRYSNSEIVLFESSVKHGENVSVIKWSDFKRNNYHLLYKKIVFRKLFCKRDEKFIKNLEDFCQNKLGAKSLLKKGSVENKNTKDIDKDKFYCSELVAATYNILGLLDDPKIPSNKYSIFQFSSKSKKPVKLKNGISLSQEYVVSFTL